MPPFATFPYLLRSGSGQHDEIIFPKPSPSTTAKKTPILKLITRSISKNPTKTITSWRQLIKIRSKEKNGNLMYTCGFRSAFLKKKLVICLRYLKLVCQLFKGVQDNKKKVLKKNKVLTLSQVAKRRLMQLLIETNTS